MSDTSKFASIRNFRQLGPLMGTSGQPEPGDFALIAAAGYEAVINLALPTSDHAIAQEGTLVTQAGMSYFHLPVSFESPTADDFASFCRILDVFRGRQIWIHCAANYRVSAFLFVYRVVRLRESMESAEIDLKAIWEPNATWASWIQDRLAERGLQRTAVVSSADLLKALRYASEKHSDQRRKDSAATPYINHPIAVAEVIARHGGREDLVMLQAALLHDTVEDTDATAVELERLFGLEVSQVVMEVTDDRSLNQQDRKQRQVEHAPHLSPRAKQVKIADKLCNCTDISRDQPSGWDPDRKWEYLNWAERVVAGCRGCNPALEQAFDDLIAAKRSHLRG